MTVQPRLATVQLDPIEAIAGDLDRSLSIPEVRVRVQQRNPWLQILFEADFIPSATACIPLVREVMNGYRPDGVRAVVVYGRILGETTPAWTYKFPLSEFAATRPAIDPLTPSTTPTVQPTPQPQPQPKPVQKNRLATRVLALSLLGFSLGGAWGLVEDLENTQVWGDRLLAAANQLGNELNTTVSQTVADLRTPSPTFTPAKTDLTAVLPPPVEIPTPNYPASITLKAVGDIVPGTNFPNNRLPADPSIFFSGVAAELQDADLTFGNFESVLTDHPYSAKDITRGAVFAFRAPPSYAGLFRDAGFDVLNIANNHSGDFGERGFLDTMAHFAEVGIATVGEKDRILYTEANGVPVAFIGFSTYDYHNSINDYDRATQLIAEARENAEIIIISIHAGAEGTGAMNVRDMQESFFGEDRGNIVRFSRHAIDTGADLILGHGPHVPRAIELYNGKLIAYSLGNFVGYETLSTEAQLAYSLILEVELNLDGDFISGNIVPAHLGYDGIPRLDGALRSVNLIRNLTQMDFPAAPITIDENGQILAIP